MKHLVAVYGTLKKAYSNHRVMEQAKGVYIGEDYVEVDRLKDVGFPCVKFKEHTNKWLLVELYEVEEENLHIIDGLEGYREGDSNSHYLRIEVPTLKDIIVSVYEYNSPIPKANNTLEIHFSRNVPAPRFYNWNRDNT